MWRFEFVGKLVAEIEVEEVFDSVSGFVQVVAWDIEVPGHVTFPQAVGSDELLCGFAAGFGEAWVGCRSVDQASPPQSPSGETLDDCPGLSRSFELWFSAGFFVTVENPEQVFGRDACGQAETVGQSHQQSMSRPEDEGQGEQATGGDGHHARCAGVERVDIDALEQGFLREGRHEKWWEGEGQDVS